MTMRTALPAPAFLREAREKARHVGPEDCRLCTPRVLYHATADRHGRVTVEQARSNPDDFIRYIEENP